ncbi:Petrobactin ABC transporter, permease protein I [Serinicoccus hydrothermalis]|uniref:Petrobactin ABC transporter, permease protein I n=1 Tax=Serinicoccus hydrothermalis TaxID=1758689 RepID=A0A1B1N978_9MICO|nr:Petrobactin ABC transporter, permease protein I [Serinicoccus hydrothermalis]
MTSGTSTRPTPDPAPSPGHATPGRGGAGRGSSAWTLPLAVLLTAGLLAVSLSVGVYDITAGEDGWAMFGITRVPRTISLVLAGAAMSMCGLVMQLLTQNRFVEPTTTGTTEWAGLGLLLVLILVPGASLLTRMTGAVVMAFLGTMVFFLFLRRVSLKSSLIVPIVGIMIGAVVGAVSTYLAMATDMLQQMGIWFAGSFTSVVRGRYEMLWIVLVVTVLVFLIADRLTVAGLGKDIATNVGLDYDRIILMGVAMVSVATGIVTVVIGSLPFLGLIVPNVVSLIRGDNLRSNLPWVCLLGVWVVTICDIIGRTIIMPFEVPVSLILGVLGAFFFIALLVIRQRRA